MRRRLLVVDDTPTVVVYLSVLLKRMGFDVISAPNGQEALRLLHARQPDIVLLDLEMPVMDGLTFLEHLGSRVPTDRPPVIVITANADPAVAARCRELGSRAVLHKPVGLRELHAEVEACLEPGFKRRHLRAPYGRAVEVSTNEGPPRPYQALTLSEGGIYIRMAEPLPRGTEVNVTLSDALLATPIKGRVIYDKGVYGEDLTVDPGVAIAFEPLVPEQAASLGVLVRRLLMADLFEIPSDAPVASGSEPGT